MRYGIGSMEVGRAVCYGQQLPFIVAATSRIATTINEQNTEIIFNAVVRLSINMSGPEIQNFTSLGKIPLKISYKHIVDPHLQLKSV